MQLIPYGRDHDNPETVLEIEWNTPAPRQLAHVGCLGCHSILTEWPWYTNAAPVSWLTQRDGRDTGGRSEPRGGSSMRHTTPNLHKRDAR